jgi:hypothetical protein
MLNMDNPQAFNKVVLDFLLDEAVLAGKSP